MLPNTYDFSALIKEEVEKELRRLRASEDEALEIIQEEDDYETEEELVELAVIHNATNVIFASELGYYSFVASHVNFDEAARTALSLIDDLQVTKSQWDYIKDLHDTSKAIVKWSNGLLSIEGNRVRFDGDLLPTSLENHLLALYKSDSQMSLKAWTKFYEKLRDASHVDTHNRLHAFLQYNDLAINDDGNILAWKAVTPDFKDKYTRSFDNNVGAIVKMPRTQVTYDPSRTCSSGLHACAFEYLKSFAHPGDQIILVEIDVRNIVSVPVDYDGKKVRCCEYIVKNHVGTWGTDINCDTDPQEVLERVL